MAFEEVFEDDITGDEEVSEETVEEEKTIQTI